MGNDIGERRRGKIMVWLEGWTWATGELLRVYTSLADLVVCVLISTSCYVSDGARKVGSDAC